MARKLVKHHLTAYIGKDFKQQFQNKTGNDNEATTSYTWEGEIKDSGGTTVQSLASVGDVTTTGIYIADASTGVVQLQVRIAELAAMGAGSYTYEVRVSDTDPAKEIFATGNFTIANNGNH